MSAKSFASEFKHISWRVIQFALTAITMLFAFILGAMIAGQTGSAALSPAEEQESSQALLIFCVINALVLSVLILRSHWSGLRLIGAVFLLQWGIQTFMTQIETVFFNSALQVSTAELLRIIASGALCALIFAPLAVLFLGKLKRGTEVDTSPVPLPLTVFDWLKRFALLAVIYVCVYFIFGYFVAWQWSETRQFYTGTTEIQPFLTNTWNTLQSSPVIFLFQLFRGLLWAGLALLAVRMLKGKPWEISLTLALLFSVLISVGLIFPNPYMPPIVRQAHFFELLSSMFVYGWVAGWVWTWARTGSLPKAHEGSAWAT